MTAKRLIFSILAIISALVLSHGALGQTPKHGGSVTIMSGRLPDLNPLGGSADSGYVTGQIFTSLTRLDDEQNVLPNLAKSWKVSEDGLSYTFYIEENAKFHDGRPITSEDVAFSAKMAQKYHRFGDAMFGPVERVETPHPHTAVFRLSQPHAAVLMSTTNARFLPIMPKHVYETAKDFDTHPAHNKPVGSGPFKITEISLAEYLIAERHDGYFRKGLPYLDRLIFRIVTDQTAIRVGLEQEQFHIAAASATMRLRDLKKFKALPHLEVEPHASANGSFVGIEFNNRVEPLNNKKVRQAIGHAIDFSFIANALHDGWTSPGKGPIVSSNPFFNKKLKGYEFSLDKANKLLDEAGYPRKENGIRFELKLLHASHFPDFFVMIPEYLVPALAKVGIKVIREQMPDRTSWSKRMADWDFQMSMTLPGGYLDPVIGVSRNYVCDNIKHITYTNTSGYCNPRVDDLFQRAAREPNFQKRKALYDEVQELLWEEAPIIWAVESDTPIIFHKELANVPIKGWGLSAPADETYWKKKPK